MSRSICFNCGQAVGDPPRLNRTDSGLVCPTCRDRLLDALPAMLPGMPVYDAPAPGDAAEVGAPVEVEGAEVDAAEAESTEEIDREGFEAD